MAREARLWGWLSKAKKSAFGRDLHMDRVENVTMAGMPDVEGQVAGADQFWIELKSTKRPARASTNIRFATRNREAQVEWLTRRWEVGGSAWLLLQVGQGAARRLYLVPGWRSAEVYAHRGIPEGRLAELSVLPEGGPSAEQVIKRAATARAEAA